MTNKIAITLIAVLVIATIVPTAYAVKDISEAGFKKTCEVHEANGKDTVMDYSCFFNLAEMWNNIITILDQLTTLFALVTTLDSNLTSVNATINEQFTSTNATINNQFSSLDERIGKTTTKANKALDRLDNHNRRIMAANSERADFDYRLQVLEGVVPPPQVGDPLVVNIFPDSITKGEKFTVYGHVDRVEQYWVDFVVYDPSGQRVQDFDFNTLQNGGFYPPAITPNDNWITIGTYTIIAEHGPHTETITIQYLG